MLPLPNKLGDPSRTCSHVHGDNKIANSFLGSGCDNSGAEEEKINLFDHLIHDNADAFPKNPCKKYPYSVEGRTFAPSDAIGGVINEESSIELIGFLDDHPHAFKPVPLSPANNLQHSNEHYRDNGVATNPMNLKLNHQPTFTPYFVQLERIRDLDPHAFEPTPLSQNHLHSSNEEQYRRSGVATNLMNLKLHHQPNFTSHFLQPLSTQLDNDPRYTQSDPIDHQQCHADLLLISINKILGDDVSSTDDGSSDSDQEAHTPRFRDYQKDQWVERFHELQQFHRKHGHSQVPDTTMKENRRLARWIKRQRYQYRLHLDGKPSAMIQERITSLENLGFIWNSCGFSAWEDRLENLYEFKALHKHCNVPSHYPPKPSLASWVKRQRRQYKLFREEKQSNMTADRINQLEKAGFQWELRSGKAVQSGVRY